MRFSRYFFTFFLVTGACGKDVSNSSQINEAWNLPNDPRYFERNYEYKLAELPASGQLDQIPWSDTYWPSYQGGIADRWQTGDDAFSYESVTSPEKMTQSQLAKLSPAEKFDLLRGRYDFPLVKAERQRTSPNAPHWEGLCHGWAPLSLLMREPKPITMSSAKGIAIPFGSSDIKALLMYHQGQLASAPSKMLGQRCNDDLGRFPRAGEKPPCRDINAGAFHLVLANRIGIRKEGFVADMTRDAEVWNQPVYGFKSTIGNGTKPSADAATGTVEEKRVRTEIYYAIEVAPNWRSQSTIFQRGRMKATFDYVLEIDAKGMVLGGRWLSQARPDFLWTQSLPKFGGEWQLLEKLYQRSILQ
jgi:hypothetical protein